MKGTLFLSRVTFLCNVLFLVCWVLRYTHNFIHHADIESITIILGWIVAPLISLGLNIWYLILFFKKVVNPVPYWLIIGNILFLIFELLNLIIFPR